jgi:hypothetical protein
MSWTCMSIRHGQPLLVISSHNRRRRIIQGHIIAADAPNNCAESYAFVAAAAINQNVIQFCALAFSVCPLTFGFQYSRQAPHSFLTIWHKSCEIQVRLFRARSSLLIVSVPYYRLTFIACVIPIIARLAVRVHHCQGRRLSRLASRKTRSKQ